MKLLLLAACLSNQSIVSAQDTIQSKKLNEVVVTAGRFDQQLNESPRSVSVITNADIQASGAQNIEQLLNKVSGIYIVGAEQNPGMTASVFLRGANSNQTEILIDGIRITDPSAINNALDLSELSLSDVDHIEIVKGAHSSLYGSSAIGGAINIVTKSASKDGFSGDLAVSAGTFGKSTHQFSEQVNLGYSHKGYFIAGGLSQNNVQGLNATVDTITQSTTFQHPDLGDDEAKTDWFLKAGYRGSKFVALVDFHSTHQQTDIDKGAFVDDDNYVIAFKRNRVGYQLSYKLNERLKLSWNGAYAVMGRTETDDSSKVNAAGDFDKTYVKNDHSGSNFSSDLQLNYAYRSSRFVIGISDYQEKMGAENRLVYYNSWGFPPDYVTQISTLDSVAPQAATYGIFVHTDLNGDLINQNWSRAGIALGARFNSHSLFGTTTTYEINPYVKLPAGGLLYGLYGTGFNAPSLYQLYDPTTYTTWDTHYSTGLTRGDKNLKAEQSNTIEIGFKQSIGTMHWELSIFKTIVNNAIEYVYLWDKNIGIDTLGQNWGRDDYRGDTYINIGKMTTQGIELSVSSSVGEKIEIGGNVSLLQGQLDYSPENIDTAQTGGNQVQLFGNGAFVDRSVRTQGLSRRPSTANLYLSYRPVKYVSLRAEVRYAGARTDVQYDASLGPYGALATVGLDPYTLLDVSVVGHLMKGLDVQFRMGNVLDEKYTEINGFTTKGRSYFVTLRYSLNQ